MVIRLEQLCPNWLASYCPGDPVIAPGPVLLGHANEQFFDVFADPIFSNQVLIAQKQLLVHGPGNWAAELRTTLDSP